GFHTSSNAGNLHAFGIVRPLLSLQDVFFDFHRLQPKKELKIRRSQMHISARIFLFTLSLLTTLVIVRMVKKKRLEEKYALLWLTAGFAMILMTLFTPWVDRISFKLGIFYPPSLVFFLAFLALCLICLQFSMTLSRLTGENRRLAQRLALLEDRLME